MERKLSNSKKNKTFQKSAKRGSLFKKNNKQDVLIKIVTVDNFSFWPGETLGHL